MSGPRDPSGIPVSAPPLTGPEARAWMRDQPLPMGWSRRETLIHDLAAALEVWDGHAPGLAGLATNPALAEHLGRAGDLADAARALLADIATHPGDA